MDFLESRPVITGRILEYKSEHARISHYFIHWQVSYPELSAVIKYKFSEYGGKKWRPEPCHRKA
jgi:hypothetical protein